MVGDVGAVGLHGEHRAGLDGLAVDEPVHAPQMPSPQRDVRAGRPHTSRR